MVYDKTGGSSVPDCRLRGTKSGGFRASDTEFRLDCAGSDGRADVCWDPNMTYIVQCITSVGTSDIGKNLNIDASAANSRTGISGMSVQIPASASLSDPFKLIGLAPFEELGGKQPSALANCGVEVAINNSFVNGPVAGQ